jgi:hypothetical protein
MWNQKIYIKDYIKFYNDKNIDEMLQDKKDTK